jgi:broad specificity phosphatase PhoE
MIARVLLSGIVPGLILSAASYAAEVQCASPPAKLILVRHGCKLDKCADTPLSEKGKEQADGLVRRLAGTKIDAIFVTHWIRTRNTAAPLAAANQLEPAAQDDTQALLTEICSKYPGKTLAYIGHSDTLDKFVTAFGFPYSAPEPGEGWIVSWKEGTPKMEALPPSGMTCEALRECAP